MARPSLDEDDPLLIIEEVARHSRVSTRTVRRWIAEGDLEVVRIRRLVRIRSSVYAIFLRRRNCRRNKK